MAPSLHGKTSNSWYNLYGRDIVVLYTIDLGRNLSTVPLAIAFILPEYILIGLIKGHDTDQLFDKWEITFQKVDYKTKILESLFNKFMFFADIYEI